MKDKELTQYSALKTCFGIVILPLQILVAKLMSLCMESALAGSVKETMHSVIKILVVACFLFLIIYFTKRYSELREGDLKQQTKLHLLQWVFQNPLNYKRVRKTGKLNEILTNDLDEFVKRYFDVIPCLWVGIVGSISYLVYLMYYSISLSVVLILIALTQAIPPLIIRRFLQANYDDCRNIEEKITEYLSNGIEGKAVIVSWGAEKWWLKGLENLHRQYLKVGIKSSNTLAVQQAVEALNENILKIGTYGLVVFMIYIKACSMEVGIQAIVLSGGLYQFVHDIMMTITQFALVQSATERMSIFEEEMDDSINPETSIIALNNVSYLEIIDSLSLTLNDTENYLIKGENGIGKTTVLMLMAGLLGPDSGQLQVGGRRLYIPQIIPELDIPIGDFLSYLEKKNEQYRNRIEKLYLMFGESPEDACTKNWNELSGGQLRKLMLSIGFALDTNWLFLDEPTSDLDESGVVTLLSLCNQRKGLVISSHDNRLFSQEYININANTKGWNCEEKCME